MNPINFMYFAHNFSQVQMNKMFSTFNNPAHFEAKFRSARGENGTIKFFNWFMELSLDNQLIVTNWVETNYKNF